MLPPQGELPTKPSKLPAEPGAATKLRGVQASPRWLAHGKLNVGRSLAAIRWAALSAFLEPPLSAFEFILILIAIVAGFAISEILSAWGRLVRARVGPRQGALYFGASLVLLAYIVRYVWDLWVLRQAEWDFIAFLLTFAPMLVLALAAYVISVPRVPAPDVLGHYLSEARPFYLLLAAFLVLWTVSDAIDSWRGITAAVGSVDRVLPVLLGRTLMVGIFLVLAHSHKQVIHRVLVPLAIGLLIAGSTILVPRL
jgi:hypothetical protein